MKQLRISLLVFLSVISLVAYSNDSDSDGNTIKPRYFGEKIYVSSEVNNAKNYNLVLFTADGEQVIVKQINFEDGEFVYPTKNLLQGVYTYYIRLDEELIARGTFIKN